MNIPLILRSSLDGSEIAFSRAILVPVWGVPKKGNAFLRLKLMSMYISLNSRWVFLIFCTRSLVFVRNKRLKISEPLKPIFVEDIFVFLNLKMFFI